jgi:hypothetical protein
MAIVNVMPNTSSIPTWLISIFAAFLGFFASALSQLFQHWYSDRRAMNKMRMIIYSEIVAMYSSLVHFHNVKTRLSAPEDIESRKKQLKERFLKFEGEKYIEDKKDVFIQMRERSTINTLYSAIHEVFGPEEEYGFFINSGLAIEIIEDCVRLHTSAWIPNDCRDPFATRQFYLEYAILSSGSCRL